MNITEEKKIIVKDRGYRIELERTEKYEEVTVWDEADGMQSIVFQEKLGRVKDMVTMLRTLINYVEPKNETYENMRMRDARAGLDHDSEMGVEGL